MTGEKWATSGPFTFADALDLANRFDLRFDDDFVDELNFACSVFIELFSDTGNDANVARERCRRFVDCKASAEKLRQVLALLEPTDVAMIERLDRQVRSTTASSLDDLQNNLLLFIQTLDHGIDLLSPNTRGPRPDAGFETAVELLVGNFERRSGKRATAYFKDETERYAGGFVDFFEDFLKRIPDAKANRRSPQARGKAIQRILQARTKRQ